MDNDDSRIGHMFVVGGFAESAILQESLRSEFGYKMNVIIPQVGKRICSMKINIVDTMDHVNSMDPVDFLDIVDVMDLLGLPW